MSPVRPATLCLLLGLAACSDDALTTVKPQIEIDPPEVDFGEGIINRDNIAELTVKNVGAGPLEITSVTIEPNEGVFFIRDFPASVASTRQAPLTIAFVPTTPRAVYSAGAVVRSNDPQRPEVIVPLTGIGGVKEIDVSPLQIDFGVVSEGTSPRRSVEIRNVGGDVLTIHEVVWTSTSTDLAPARGWFRGGRLQAQTSTVIDLVYSPTDLGRDSGTLTIRSDDEDEGEVVVDVRGTANLAPRAIAWGCEVGGQIGCQGVDKGRRFTLSIGERVGLDGLESSDPEGSVITGFRWQVVLQPPNSTSAVFHSTEDRLERKMATGDFEVSTVGRYDLRLIVRDSRGLESLDTPESHILLAPKDLEILLKWDIDTDVDLHVVRPDGALGDYGTGSAGTSTGSDCSTFNRAPNWGELGSSIDDPRLDIDVVTGRGPEVVSMNAPQTGEAYRVVAHYCDSQNVRVPVNVTIEIYVEGTLVATVPEVGRTISLAPSEAWEGAHVLWIPGNPPQAQVIPRLDALPEMRPALCMLR